MPVVKEHFVRKMFEKQVVGPDLLTTPNAVLQAFESGKYRISSRVVDFVKNVNYGPSNYGFSVVARTPEGFGLEEGIILSEFLKFAKSKPDLGLLSEQEVFRLRCSLEEEKGEMFLAPTRQIFQRKKPHLYLLEHLILSDSLCLSYVDGSQDQRLHLGSKVLFKYYE